MRSIIPMMCAISTFVIMTDNQRIVAAKSLAKREVEQLPTKYDNIDIQRILNSKRLLANYIKCLLDEIPCTAEGKDLKKYLPQALATECAGCSEIQKKKAGEVLSHILQYHRDYWDQLIAKYDADGNYRKKYEIDEDYVEED